MQRNKGVQGRGVKIKPSLPTVKHLPEKSATVKPLAGRVFYLDIQSKVISEKLEKDIKDLGGTIEGFLSKEISYLITSKKEAKCKKSLKYSSSLPSPEPIKNAGKGLTRPGSHRSGNQDGDCNKKPEKDDVSRGKSLLKKVIKEQELLPKNSILANALNWGVRILHVDEAKIYIEQKKKSLQQVKQPESTKAVVKQPARRKAKAQKLKSPYLKVEDNSCLYRPLYLVLPLFRSFQSPPSKSCQSVDKKAATANKQATETKQGLNKTWHGQDGGNNSHCKVREQKRRGYCECCLQKYDDLEAHLVGQQHKNFSQGPYYQDVDNLISVFDFDFVDWSRCRQEAKSSVLLPAETIKQEEMEIPEVHPQICSQIPSTVNQEPTNVQHTELGPPQATDVGLSNISSQCPGAVDSLQPTQSLCNAYVLDSNSRPPGSPLLIPETAVSPVPAGDTLCDVKQNDTQNREGIPDVSTFQLSLKSAHCLSSSEHENGCPSKKIKLDDCLFSKSEGVDRLTNPTPSIETVHEDLDTLFISNHPKVLSNRSPSSSPSKPHRKVNTLLYRELESLYYMPVCKVSVPKEQMDSPTDRLVALFETSEAGSEFCGFSCNSENRPHNLDEEDQTFSHDSLLWSLFSQTSSSAATFYGF